MRLALDLRGGPAGLRVTHRPPLVWLKHRGRFSGHWRQRCPCLVAFFLKEMEFSAARFQKPATATPCNVATHQRRDRPTDGHPAPAPDSPSPTVWPLSVSFPWSATTPGYHPAARKRLLEPMTILGPKENQCSFLLEPRSMVWTTEPQTIPASDLEHTVVRWGQQ